MRVTIVLETGGFFPSDGAEGTPLDVGYFQTPGPIDVKVSEDGQIVQPKPDPKLGKGANRIISVEHLKKDGTVKEEVKRSKWFDLDILKKDDLYPPAQIPVYNAGKYDCILRFHSGDFNSADVRGRRFTEHLLSDGKPTGIDKHTRAIANEIHVEYDVADGEVLRLRSPEGRDIWSSASVGRGVKRVVVTILTHAQASSSYHKDALDHTGSHYYLPNSDPPPMNGP